MLENSVGTLSERYTRTQMIYSHLSPPTNQWKNAIEIKLRLIINIIITTLLLMFPLEVQADDVVTNEVVVTWEDKFTELPIELQKIALCESDVNKDGVPDLEASNSKSSATGIFQFIDSTFAWVWGEVYDTPVDWTKKNDPFIQIELANWLYNKYGNSQWQYPCGSLRE